MTTPTKAFIEGGGVGTVALSGNTPIAWTLKGGAIAHQERIETDAAGGKKIIEAAKNAGGSPKFTLVIESAGQTLRIEKLIILGETPASSPLFKAFLITDIRWQWTRRHILRRYNIRRRTRMVKRLGPNDAPVQITQLQPDIEFAAFSLNPPNAETGRRWQPDDIVLDVLNELSPGKVDNGTVSAVLRNARFAGIPIENFEIDDDGTNAVSRVMKLFAGIDVFVNQKGRISVYDKINGAEKFIIQKSGPEIIGGGHVDFIDFSPTRPFEVHVLFTREMEVRFDFIETGPDDTVVPVGPDDRFLENVLPIPDIELKVGGQNLVQGTYITIDEALAAWNQDQANVKAKEIPMTKRLIQDSWITNAFFAFWSQLGFLNPDQNWAARVNAIRSHYRQTFRINRRWMDRIRTLRATRVSILNPETGARAPAAAYSNYAMLPTEQGLLSNIEENATIAVNVDGFQIFEADTNEPLLLGARINPAVVTILDAEQGIFQLNYRTDPIGHFREIVPSAIENPPTLDPKRINEIRQLITFDSVKDKEGKSLAKAKQLVGDVISDTKDAFSINLERSFRLAVVLTAIPAAPNSNFQLHRVVVTPDMAIQSEGGNGPVWEVRVGASVETARFMWLDDKKLFIEGAFGVPFEIGQGPSVAASDLEPMLVNGGGEQFGQQGNIFEIARAVATRIYRAMVDRFQGVKTVRMLPDIGLTGSLAGIRHVLNPNGDAFTQFNINPELEPIDIFAVLPDKVRNVVLRQVSEDK